MSPDIIMDIIVACVIVLIIVIGIFMNASRSKAAKMEKQGRIDSLTGIPNRSGEEEIIRLLERRIVGMFLIIDIDDFKAINESYGKEVGDKVLVALANCMVDVFRSSDVILRVEADEFAVFCPRIRTREVGCSVIERFISNVNRLKIPEIDKSHFSISIGASFYSGQEEYHYGDLFDAAFERCELSKEIEGNSYTVDDPIEDEEEDTEGMTQENTEGMGQDKEKGRND